MLDFKCQEHTVVVTYLPTFAMAAAIPPVPKATCNPGCLACSDRLSHANPSGQPSTSLFALEKSRKSTIDGRGGKEPGVPGTEGLGCCWMMTRELAENAHG